MKEIDNNLKNLTKKEKTTDVEIKIDDFNIKPYIDNQALDEYISQLKDNDCIKAILCIGDQFQLLPLDGSPQIITDKNNKNIFNLNKIIRQDENSYILNISSKIREIIETKNYPDIKIFIQQNFIRREIKLFEKIEDFYNDFFNHINEDVIITGYSNEQVNIHNEKIRKMYWNSHNIDYSDTIIVGDKIIFQKANINKINNQDVVVHYNNDIVKVEKVEECFEPRLKINYYNCFDQDNKEFNEYKEIVELLINHGTIEDTGDLGSLFAD